jgi:hypothetical protein
MESAANSMQKKIEECDSVLLAIKDPTLKGRVAAVQAVLKRNMNILAGKVQYICCLLNLT